MNGILNVYKEKGYTSHDVVAKLRRICRQKKIGHTGTLDPDAEGVLPVCFGTATKVCGLLTDKDKEYEAVLLLGVETDTQDVSGSVCRQSAVTCSEAAVREAIRSFLGGYDQIPPMYSALKVNGKKLCDLARAGVEIERKPRFVRIYDIAIEWIRLPQVKIKVHCSKGTYIRTLCHDIGQVCGRGGCMEALLRTRVSIFPVEEAIRLHEIETLAAEGRLEERLLAPDRLFAGLPSAQVTAGFFRLLENGNRLPKHALRIDGSAQNQDAVHDIRVYRDQVFFGIYALDEACGDYKPVKRFWQRDESGL